MTPTREPAENCHDTPGSPTINGVTGKTGRGTARQTFRYDSDKWDKVGAAAVAAGTDRSVIIREFLDWVMGDPEAPEPRRLVEPTDKMPDTLK